MTMPLPNSNNNLPIQYLNGFVQIVDAIFEPLNNPPNHIYTHQGHVIQMYHFDSQNGGFKNGVWIRFNPQIWLHVLINENLSKKVEIWSSYNLNIPGYNQGPRNTYSLPPNFDQTPVFKEANIVNNAATNESLMNQIVIRLNLLINLNQNL